MQANNQETTSTASTTEPTVNNNQKQDRRNLPGAVLVWAYEHYLEFDLPAVEKTIKDVCGESDEAMVLYKQALLEKSIRFFTELIMG